MLGCLRNCRLLGLLLLAGCMTLSTTQESHSVSPPEFAGKVYLFRDVSGTLSFGMDTIAKQLTTIGLANEVTFHPHWRFLAGRLAKERETLPGPLVLVGHSYGADAALRLARKLDERNIPVDLVVTIDPVTPPHVPKNVRRACNIYRAGGILDAVPILRGVALVADGLAQNADLENINVQERPELNFPGLNHANIDDNPIIQQEVIRQILKCCKRS